jgi:peptidoglycan/xylan/chitin deacetylase (PgdA/CDA1 family)
MKAASLFARARSRAQREASFHMARRSIRMRNSSPLISFSFDDFPRSALLAGGRILQARGVRGTFYVSFGLMGSVAPTGEIFAETDLLHLGEHELGCHTFDHCDSWLTDTAAFEQSILRNSMALAKYVPGGVFRSLSYPISEPRPSTKTMCGRHFVACRAGGQRTNSSVCDLNSLRSFFLERSRDSLDEIQRQIQVNVETNGWLIFSTHDVSTTPTKFGVTPDFFEQVVQRAADSGALLLPVGDALDVIMGKPLATPRDSGAGAAIKL